MLKAVVILEPRDSAEYYRAFRDRLNELGVVAQITRYSWAFEAEDGLDPPLNCWKLQEKLLPCIYPEDRLAIIAAGDSATFIHPRSSVSDLRSVLGTLL